jgi:hypothetical protein
MRNAHERVAGMGSPPFLKDYAQDVLIWVGEGGKTRKAKSTPAMQQQKAIICWMGFRRN